MTTPYPIQIRNAAADLVATIDIFEGRVKRSAMLPIVSEDLPCARVTTVGRSMSADGSATTGEPQFVSMMKLGISGLVSADTVDDLDADLNQVTEDILDALLSNTAWLLLIEGVTQIDCSYHLVNQADQSDRTELLMAEARVILTIQYREFFEPAIPDLLAEVSVGTRLPGATTAKPFGAAFDLPTT